MQLPESVRANLRHARLDRGELSGSLGDLGTFLPLLVGMSVQNGLSFAAGLFFQVQPANAFVALATVGACLGLGNVGFGFCVGLAIAWSMAAVGRFRARREEERGRRPM